MQPDSDQGPEPTDQSAPDAESGDTETDLEAQVDAYDLDEDGKISLVEMERARLGVVDARMEELADEGGVKGKLAEAAHKVLDKIDNDE